tara:strand:- start:19205 stop:19390 length:186 start_codon:yes stop_codon:yes gene_type:complete
MERHVAGLIPHPERRRIGMAIGLRIASRMLSAALGAPRGGRNPPQSTRNNVPRRLVDQASP